MFRIGIVTLALSCALGAFACNQPAPPVVKRGAKPAPTATPASPRGAPSTWDNAQPPPQAAPAATPAPAEALPESNGVFRCVKPTGWVDRVESPSTGDALVCGAWRHPSFLSVITVTYFPKKDADELSSFAVKTVQRQKAKGYAIDDFAQDEKSAQIKLSLRANDSSPAQTGLMDLLATRDGHLMLIAGSWDASQADLGMAGYVETLNGVDMVDLSHAPGVSQ